MVPRTILPSLAVLLLVVLGGADSPQPAATPATDPPPAAPEASETKSATEPAASEAPQAASSTVKPAASDAPQAVNPHASTLREGTELVDTVGQFRLAGERVAFFSADGKGRFLVLENLNLQRIVRVLSDSSIPLDWRVSGELTEYRGTNYLYVRSAVLKAGSEVREDISP